MGSLTPLLKPDVTLSLALSPSASHATSPKPEEIGIRLIQLLLKCAEHVTSGNLHRANTCLAEISELSSVTGNSMQRLAARFASALAIRLVKRWPGIHKALSHAQQSKLELDQAQAQAHFTEAFPYLRFAYAIIARTLLQAMNHERVIHIVDLGSCDPKLWIPLLRGFANSPNGPPHLKITCVSKNKAGLDKLGLRLVKEAEALDMPFQFNPLNVTLRDLTIDMIHVRPGESLAFVSILSLHVLLAEDDRVDAHFGANKADGGVKDCKQLSDFLEMLRSMSPKLLFLVEQEAEHNLTKCFYRFVEGLYYYSAIFDSIDATLGPVVGDERIILEEMFGREIENIVACEGVERYERHERYGNWAIRLSRAGLRPVRLWSSCDEEGSKQILGAFGKDGYKIVSVRTCLMICWHERPLYAVTAWTC